MRYFTITKIKKWCKQKNIASLIDALNSTDPEIRKASILCLGEIGDAIVEDSIKHIIEYDPDIFVKKTAERALLNIQRAGINSRITIEPNKINISYNLNIS